MDRKIFIIFGFLVFVFLMVVFLGGRMARSELEKEARGLFASSADVSYKKYSSEDLAGLPEPVQRYFRYALTENQSYVSYVRLTHGGWFWPSPGRGFPIKGNEYFTTQKPGFLWSGRVPLMSAKDSYADGEGNLKVRLVSLLTMVDARGAEVNQGEILRFLGEAPLFPTALLPSENLRWEPVDSTSARVFFTDGGLTVDGVFSFNEKGEITSFKARRYKEKTLENWTGYFGDYREVDGMRVPFYLEARWNLDSGDFTYVKFNITRVDYDKPEAFG